MRRTRILIPLYDQPDPEWLMERRNIASIAVRTVALMRRHTIKKLPRLSFGLREKTEFDDPYGIMYDATEEEPMWS